MTLTEDAVEFFRGAMRPDQLAKHEGGGHDQKTHGSWASGGPTPSSEAVRFQGALDRLGRALPNADLLGLRYQDSHPTFGDSDNVERAYREEHPDGKWLDESRYREVPTADELEGVADAAEKLAQVSPQAAKDVRSVAFSDISVFGRLSVDPGAGNKMDIRFNLQRIRAKRLGEQVRADLMQARGKPTRPSSDRLDSGFHSTLLGDPGATIRFVAMHEFAHSLAASGEVAGMLLSGQRLPPGVKVERVLLFDPGPETLPRNYSEALVNRNGVTKYAEKNPGEFFAENAAALWSGDKALTPDPDTQDWIKSYARWRRQYTGSSMAKGGGVIVIEDDFGESDLSLEALIGAPIAKRIEHRGTKWVVVAESGREMGTYATKAEAVKRLRQIEHFKKGHESTGVMLAIKLPPSVAGPLRVTADSTGGKPVELDEIHTTVVYLGKQGEVDTTKVEDVVRRWAGALPPQRLQAQGSVTWDNRPKGDHVSVLEIEAAALEKNREALVASLREAGVEPKGKGADDWRPHVTLAYDPESEPVVELGARDQFEATEVYLVDGPAWTPIQFGLVKHGTHDQKTHGSWATGPGTGQPSLADVVEPATPGDVERAMARAKSKLQDGAYVRLDGLSDDVAESVLNAVAHFGEVFPEAANELVIIDTKDPLAKEVGAVAATYEVSWDDDAGNTRHGTRISIDVDAISDTTTLALREIIGDSVMGSPYGVMTHELGHVLDFHRAHQANPGVMLSADEGAKLDFKESKDYLDPAGEREGMHRNDRIVFAFSTLSDMARENTSEALAEGYVAWWAERTGYRSSNMETRFGKTIEEQSPAFKLMLDRLVNG